MQGQNSPRAEIAPVHKLDRLKRQWAQGVLHVRFPRNQNVPGIPTALQSVKRMCRRILNLRKNWWFHRSSCVPIWVFRRRDVSLSRQGSQNRLERSWKRNTSTPEKRTLLMAKLRRPRSIPVVAQVEKFKPQTRLSCFGTAPPIVPLFPAGSIAPSVGKLGTVRHDREASAGCLHPGPQVSDTAAATAA